MASAVNNDDDFVTCGVCLIEYDTEDKKPKFLQCSHTFCLQCLKQICQDGSITCPFCRKTFVLEDISAVPNNSYALHILKLNEKDVTRNLDALINLKKELMEMKAQKTDKLVKAIEKRKQVQEKFSKILKSIKTAKEHIKTIQDENNLKLTEMVSILEQDFDGPIQNENKRDLSLSELINLVDDSSPDDTAETLRLKMAKSLQLSEEKLNEATALESEYDNIDFDL